MLNILLIFKLLQIYLKYGSFCLSVRYTKLPFELFCPIITDSVMAINVAGVETAGALLVVKMVPTEVVKMVHTEDVKMAHMVVVKMVHMVVVKMVQEAIGMNIVHITVVDPTMISNVVIMEVIICHLEVSLFC